MAIKLIVPLSAVPEKGTVTKLTGENSIGKPVLQCCTPRTGNK